MSEKIYKSMSQTGGGNIALGVIVLVIGIASGALLIVSGARLLKRRYDMTI